LLTPLEVAAWLQVPVATLYRWRYDGKGPRAAKIGRHLRYRPEEVERWLHEAEATS
jgi:excisionase family DNA binding protein